MSTWFSSEPDRVSGKAFTLQKVQAPVLTALGNTPMLTRADLEHPSCVACYRPTSDAAVGYCRGCVESGAALRHRSHPHRGGP